MDTSEIPKSLVRLAKYYTILQLFHITFLTRAGIIYLTESRIPFPAQPPPGGWGTETIHFLFGMGVTDGLAAGLTLYAGWKLIRKAIFLSKIWAVSITIAMTSAVIFCFGTLPSGAWQTNTLGYGIVALVFSPLLIFFLIFIKYLNKR